MKYDIQLLTKRLGKNLLFLFSPCPTTLMLPTILDSGAIYSCLSVNMSCFVCSLSHWPHYCLHPLLCYIIYRNYFVTGSRCDIFTHDIRSNTNYKYITSRHFYRLVLILWQMATGIKRKSCKITNRYIPFVLIFDQQLSKVA
jgi:hypothetical protein